MDPDKVAEVMLRVSKAYLPERIVYMVGAAAGVFLLLFIAYTKLSEFDAAVATAIFGAGGLFASTAYGVLRAFTKTLDATVTLLSMAKPAGTDSEGNG